MTESIKKLIRLFTKKQNTLYSNRHKNDAIKFLKIHPCSNMQNVEDTLTYMKFNTLKNINT